MQKVVIIGAGFGGMATAALLAKAGYEVIVVEKNERAGGRANLLQKNGFTFDMGPSWYLMPEIFEQFFNVLEEKSSDYYTLEKLGPSYRIFFKEDKTSVDIYGDVAKDRKTIESLEAGAAKQLDAYLERAKFQYETARDRFLYKNYDSILDFFTWQVIKDGLRLSVFTKMQTYVARFFTSPKVQKIMQYTLVFLGSSPYNTPALYSLMSHIDFNQGVFYPKGGIYEVVKAMETVAKKMGATFKYHAEVENIIVNANAEAKGVVLKDGEVIEADIVISNADYVHTEEVLLKKEWQRKRFKPAQKTWAPSALLMYIGINKKLTSLKHHTLIFSEDWKKNFAQIFDEPTWPEDPSLYICVASQTDRAVAPAGKDGIFILVPIAAGLEYEESDVKTYGAKVIKTIEEVTGEAWQEKIEFIEYFCVKDFEAQYHSYKGTALGLAHTLPQTAVWRPNNTHPNVKNLYFVGAGTNPGIGMPMCLISAELVVKRIKNIKTDTPLTPEDL